MTETIQVRPLIRTDHLAATTAVVAAFPSAPRERELQRVRHVHSTDPDGAWVAVASGQIVGVTLSLRRGRLWVLSQLAVAPDYQGHGIGEKLLARAIEYGATAESAMFTSTTDPRALHRYVRADFALRSSFTARGKVDRSALPASPRARPRDVGDTLRAQAWASSIARGAPHGSDVSALVAEGGQLISADRGFAVHQDGSPLLIAAVDAAAATELASASLRAAPNGATVRMDYIPATNRSLLALADAAGLKLSPCGPICTRGPVGSLATYLPNPFYL